MNPRVLVVHSDADDFRDMRAVLEGRGLTVDAVHEPDALASLESRRPDVILLEVGVPPMRGMEVLDRIRANPQHTGIPVILMAADADDEDLLEGYKFGADYYLTKPFSPRHLLYAVGLVLGREFPE
jgi:two-component system alkaline phosphatase synthesis response regulator PhoP/two-component system response regulator VicR